MTTRRLLVGCAVVAGIVLGAELLGGGGHGHVTHRAIRALRRAATPTTSSTTTSTNPLLGTSTQPRFTHRDDDPAPATGSPGPRPAPLTESGAVPEGVAARYAHVWGTLSVAGAVDRVEALTALATPALSARLRRSAPTARRDAQRGLPAGGELSARPQVVALGPVHGGLTSGVVVLIQSLRAAGSGRRLTTSQTYLVSLRRTGQGWRVSQFHSQS